MPRPKMPELKRHGQRMLGQRMRWQQMPRQPMRWQRMLEQRTQGLKMPKNSMPVLPRRGMY